MDLKYFLMQKFKDFLIFNFKLDKLIKLDLKRIIVIKKILRKI
jgi:hypothetical protein